MEEIVQMELILLLVNVNLDILEQSVKATLMNAHQILVKMEEHVQMELILLLVNANLDILE